MKDGRTIFNMKNEDLMGNLSQQLLIAFNESKYYLEFQFLCLRCLGISVNALYCKHCKYTYCENCIHVLPASKIKCICTKTSKQNFEFQINKELLNTHYFIKDRSSLYNRQISYSEALTWLNKSPYMFIPSEDGDSTSYAIKYYNNNCRQTNFIVSRHQISYLHQFSLKDARLMNFHFAKGYSLSLQEKVFCSNDGNFLRVTYLKKIELNKCLWSIDFSFSLYKTIRINKNKLKLFKLFNNIGWINLKSYLIIFNSFTFCSKVEIIELMFPRTYLKDIQISQSFYEFLSNCYILKEITFVGFPFYDYMNFKPFKRLVSLQSLVLNYCTFNLNSVEYMYLNNFPKIIKKIYLLENHIVNSFSGKKIGLKNPFLHKDFKFPSILDLRLFDSSNSLENLVFEALIKSESISVKSLGIFFSNLWNSIPIATFFKFIKVSNIQFLSLENLVNTQGFDSDEFCEFLRNSKFLHSLKLTNIKQHDFNTGLIFQALAFNKSIKVLYLQNMHLLNVFSDLINLILSNKVITILSLRFSDFQIYLDFYKAFSKNKSILYLDLSYKKINNDDAGKLSKLNLKGINVANTGISKSNEEMIYKKIPKFEAPDYIYECEKFLKENKDNS